MQEPSASLKHVRADADIRLWFTELAGLVRDLTPISLGVLRAAGDARHQLHGPVVSGDPAAG